MSNLTKQLKQEIDSMSYEQLLSKWRFSPVGSPIFQGESGTYFSQKMTKLREQGADHVGISKRLGWK